jgi:putative spermidine/putrescine transport system permease protein
MNRLISASYWVALATVLAFITLPLLVVVAASLSPTADITFLPWEWTAKWYGEIVAQRWLQPFWLSVRIALAVSAISGVIGMLAA